MAWDPEADRRLRPGRVSSRIVFKDSGQPRDALTRLSSRVQGRKSRERCVCCHESPSNHAEAGHMTNDEKITYYLRDMRQKGVRSWTAAPPIYRLLWRLGIKVRPPLFASFRSLFWRWAIFYLCFFLLVWWGQGISWGQGSSHFWWWEGGNHSISGLVGCGVGAAICGLVIPAIIRRKARKLALPRWEDYPNP